MSRRDKSRRCTARVIEIRVAELRQLFNAIDPSPFHQRDLDPRAEEFIVEWASDLPRDKPWGLVVHLDRPAGLADESAALRDAIHEYFGQRVVAAKRRLRELFRRGRISLVIALAFLASVIFTHVAADKRGGGCDIRMPIVRLTPAVRAILVETIAEMLVHEPQRE